METRTFGAGPRHQTFKRDFDKLLKKHGTRLTAQELLAVASYSVGILVALQDQRTTTPEMAMEIVASNIQAGNSAVVEDISKTKGNG